MTMKYVFIPEACLGLMKKVKFDFCFKTLITLGRFEKLIAKLL